MPCVNREGSSHALNSERVLGRKMCEICPKFRRPNLLFGFQGRFNLFQPIEAYSHSPLIPNQATEPNDAEWGSHTESTPFPRPADEVFPLRVRRIRRSVIFPKTSSFLGGEQGEQGEQPHNRWLFLFHARGNTRGTQGNIPQSASGCCSQHSLFRSPCSPMLE